MKTCLSCTLFSKQLLGLIHETCVRSHLIVNCVRTFPGTFRKSLFFSFMCIHGCFLMPITCAGLCIKLNIHKTVSISYTWDKHKNRGLHMCHEYHIGCS
uniref:Uncharacterized protein n=1 Tax=Anguilla anguilla TaxID=7936 RepID=A0A0E9WCF9_ANGAN